jgi:DNA mismatch repair protein MutS
MRQYQQFKTQHPGYVLFFRMGDFYEMFWDDAIICSKVLGVALTSRSKGDDAIPMAGVPFHAVEGYLRKMIAAGHRVALCEQMEDASQAKGVVRREVVRLMTPGTLTDEPLLDGRSENFLAAIATAVPKAGGGGGVGLAWAELSTGALYTMSGPRSQIIDELARLSVAEVLIPEMPSGELHEINRDVSKSLSAGRSVNTPRPGWQFTQHHALETIRKQWGTASAAGFGLSDDDPALLALGAILSYLEETQKSALTHLKLPRKHDAASHLLIDPASWRSLEVERTVRSNSVQGSLLSAIDRTRTAMGARLLRQWLRYPLTDADHITARQDAIAELLDNPPLLQKVTSTLDGVCDIERIMSRLAVNRATPRDLASLARCLQALPTLLQDLNPQSQIPNPKSQITGIQSAIRNPQSAIAPELAALKDFCHQQSSFLTRAIKPDPALNLREGGVIAPGFDPELDRLHAIGTNGAQWLANYQQQLASQTAIPSLKVSYNKVFGYYIEVTDTHRSKIPENGGWIRKQTVKNAERYITEDLKKFEDEALTASERSVALEQKLFEQIRQTLLPLLPQFQELAAGLARLDVLSSLANLAKDRKYTRPSIVDGRQLTILEGKHPVLEQHLGPEFVANDVTFNDADCLQLITGPNMAGKSTFIRQVALLVLLAQTGSYVPAKSMTLALADRLFTRIGASDELHGGQSTFMVEMTETANLLNNATPNSLVVLDEIGRGTSTLDGLSLAWAIAEHIASEVRCRTLFATHYHELTDLSQRFKSVKNLNVAVREWQDQIIFLHRIVEGGTDRSYGIHVAKLAGIPPAVLERSKQLLSELTVQHVSKPRISKSKRPDDIGQMVLFEDPQVEFRRELANLKLEDLSPAQLYDWLGKWKAKLR